MITMKTVNEIKEVMNVLKAEIKVNSIGKPDLMALPETEKRIFFETLLAHIKELCAEEDSKTPKQDKQK